MRVCAEVVAGRLKAESSVSFNFRTSPNTAIRKFYTIYFASFLNWNLIPTDKKAESIWTEKEMRHKT